MGGIEIEKSTYLNEATDAIHETGHSTPFQNSTSSTIAWTWTGSMTVTADASVNASLEAGWGPIKATLGASADLSISQTYSNASTVNLPAHWWGWVRFGYAYNQNYGEYAYQDQYGNLSSISYITVTSPQYATEQVFDASTAPSNP